MKRIVKMIQSTLVSVKDFKGHLSCDQLIVLTLLNRTSTEPNRQKNQEWLQFRNISHLFFIYYENSPVDLGGKCSYLGTRQHSPNPQRKK